MLILDVVNGMHIEYEQLYEQREKMMRMMMMMMMLDESEWSDERGMMRQMRLIRIHSHPQQLFHQSLDACDSY